MAVAAARSRRHLLPPHRRGPDASPAAVAAQRGPWQLRVWREHTEAARLTGALFDTRGWTADWTALLAA